MTIESRYDDEESYIEQEYEERLIDEDEYIRPPTGYCKYCSNPDIGCYVMHSGYCPKLHEIFTQREQEESLIDEITDAVTKALYDEIYTYE